jgi:hypothetical protein
LSGRTVSGRGDIWKTGNPERLSGALQAEDLSGAGNVETVHQKNAAKGAGRPDRRSGK